MTGEQALAFVRQHGVVLASAKGPVPNMVEAVANEPVKGSWWGHPKGREIFRVLQGLHASSEILVCRLVEGKVTFVHRRLWPALVRVAQYFPVQRVAQVHEEHTAAGHHVTHDLMFPKWVPPEIIKQAGNLDEREALSMLGAWATQKQEVRKRAKPQKGVC
jgi:hypothetical protein